MAKFNLFYITGIEEDREQDAQINTMAEGDCDGCVELGSYTIDNIQDNCSCSTLFVAFGLAYPV